MRSVTKAARHTGGLCLHVIPIAAAAPNFGGGDTNKEVFTRQRSTAMKTRLRRQERR